MDFVKEFATFLHEKKALRFGDFTLASGKKSSYYIDLRLIASYPHIFRKMIMHLQKLISEKTGFDNFDCIATVPTGGLVIASALAFEILKPLVYIRDKPKEYGTSKSIEGHIFDGQKMLLVDDVATTGGSIVKAIEKLKDAGTLVSDSYVIINRMEGADKALEEKGVKMHQLTDILEISKILNEAKLIDDKTLESVKNQVSK